MGKGELTRQEIIRLAAPVFNQRGFAGTSMQDLMQATGFEKGGLYRHFSSKQELAVEAFRYVATRAVERRSGMLSEIPHSVDKLRHMVQTFVDVPSSVPGGCPLMNTAVDADDTNPELCALALEAIRAWKSRLSWIVREGIEAGEIRRKTNPDRLANLLVSTLEGALMISRLEGSRTAVEDVRDSLWEVLDGIERPR